MDRDHVSSALRVLDSRTATRDEKQQAFEIVKQSFVPVINQTSEYAAELERVFALRFPIWPEPPLSVTTAMADPQLLADRIRGLVFGNALGDAVGLATEFLSQAEVAQYYPNADHVFRPSARFHPDIHRLNFPQGDWTDDTDQMILILQTMLEHQGRYNGPAFAEKFVHWKNHGFAGLGDTSGAGCGRSTMAVLQHAAFRSNPHQAAQEVWERSGKAMAANGAVMRTSITAVPHFYDAAAVQETTTNFCRATHADPRCRVSCLVIAETARLVLMQMTTTMIVPCPPPERIPDLIEQAIASSLQAVGEDLDQNSVQDFEFHARVTDLADLKLDEERSIGYTYKCMGSGLWALRTAAAMMVQEQEDQQQSSAAGSLQQQVIIDVLQELVRAGGDADTNGAVAGALLGAYFGHAALPWTTDMPYAFWLEAWVQKLLFMLRLPIVHNK